jgi:hypothetical protein
MKKALAVIAVLLAAFAILYIGASWYFSSFVVKFDVKSLDAQRVEKGTPADFGLPQPEEVAIPGDGVTLAGWLFDNPQDGDCGAVLLHGITDNRYGMLKYAPLFWPRGCDILVYDHRYHGASTGDHGTYGYYEKQDALAALNWFSQRTGLPASRIGLMGESYGAATALEAAALRPDLAFVASDSSYRDLKTIVAEQGVEQYGGWIKALVPGALAISGLRARFAPSEVSPMDDVRTIREPIFLSHSATDGFTLAHHSQDIDAEIPATVCHRLHLTDWGSEHAESIDDDFSAYKAQFDEFLNACVPGFGAAGGS